MKLDSPAHEKGPDERTSEANSSHSNQTEQTLLPQHAKLITSSGVSSEIAATRGYRSVTNISDLKRLGFSEAQCIVPALIVPVWGVHGEVVLHQSRPDSPRIKNGRSIKYETPRGARMAIDAHPSIRQRLKDPSNPLIITEGVRKADSALSRGLVCIALLGVWNWRGTNESNGKTALPDWESIALNGRLVYLCFDSDVTQKREVRTALHRLRAFLELRGAIVAVIHLPSGDGGEKVGLDDFFSSGKSVDDLLALASINSKHSKAENDEFPSRFSADSHDLRPAVQQRPRDLLDFTREVWKIIIAANEPPQVFRFGDLLSEIETHSDGGACLRSIDEHRMRDLASRHMRFLKIDKKGAGAPSYPDAPQCHGLIIDGMRRSLPNLVGICQFPILLRNPWRILTERGWNAATQLYLDLRPADIAALSTGSSQADVTAARSFIIDEVLADFDFPDLSDLANAVAALLAPIIQSDIRPHFVLTAPKPNSGKTTLARTVAVVASRQEPGLLSFPKGHHETDEEVEKRITAILRTSPSVVLIDNLARLLDDSSLMTALTAPIWEGRVLGKSQILRLPNRATWFFSGNDLKLSSEMTLRVILIRLNPLDLGRALKREDPAHWALENRPRILSALVTLIRGWIEAGAPMGCAAHPKAPGWSRIVSGILDVSGIPGFDANRPALESTSDNGQLERFVDVWWARFCDSEVRPGQLCALAEETGQLVVARGAKPGRSAETRVGFLLRNAKGRLFGGREIVGREDADGPRYRLISDGQD